MKTKEELDAMQAEANKLWEDLKLIRGPYDLALSAWCQAENAVKRERMKSELLAEIERDAADSAGRACGAGCGCHKDA